MLTPQRIIIINWDLMLAVYMPMSKTQFLYMLEEEESENFHTLINHRVQTHKR